MRHILFVRPSVVLTFFIFGNLLTAQTSQTAAFPQLRAWEAGERGANHRVWNRINQVVDMDGRPLLTTNQAYVELATGMHYWDGNQWKESREEFEVGSGGYAMAHSGQHKVMVSPTLNDASGAVTLQTPSGRRMRSTILGLTLHDRLSGTNVLVATIKGGVGGRKTSANEIVFPDCFDTIRADVRFTFQRGGFHQDVILREAIDAAWVEQAGCNSNTTRLEIWTEFFEAPTPQANERVMSGITDPMVRGLVAVPDVIEDDLDFGDMKMPLGRAYAQRNGGAQGSVQVPKRWTRINGRTFLVESMSLAELKPLFAGMSDWRPTGGSKGRPVYVGVRPPEPELVEAGTNSILTASVSHALDDSGVVLDYQVVNSGGNYTFKSDTTYYVSGQVWLSGAAVFEGGTVIKYAPGANWIYVAGSVDCQTGPYRPAVFTSKNDNSVGETISGSTGSPTIDAQNHYLRLYFLSSAKLHHLRMSYAYCGLNANYGNAEVSDLQFVHNGNPLYVQGTTTFKARNILMDDVSYQAFYGAGAAISAEHLTIWDCPKLGQNEWGSSLAVTNSLLVNVPNLGNMTLATNCVTRLSSGTGVFQTVGAGSLYLAANSPYRNTGTTNIDPGLLASLKQKTTYPPVLYSNVTFTTNILLVPQAARDTNAPDLGYHYEPVDYLVDLCLITNATLTITNGTVVASYLDSAGLWLQDGSSIRAVGTPDQPIHFTYYNTAQEQPVFLSTIPRTNFTSAILINPYHSGPTIPSGPLGKFQFSKFSGLAGAGVPLSHQSGGWEFGSLSVRDCEFGPVYDFLSLAPTTNTVTAFNNNLFYRTAVKVTPQNGGICTLSNNLFWGSNMVQLRPVIGGGSVYAFDNAFDGSILNQGIPGMNGILNNDCNAYITCTGTVPLTNAGPHNVFLTNSLAYQSGPLGNFYQPTSSALRNAGSVSNAATIGFYYYTTTTNQVWETNSTVDIGYHYVSVDVATGLPIDSDWDGIPDFEDADSDSDGLADNWEIQYFGDLDQTATGDLDGDGLNNGLEYQMGYDPTTAHTGGSSAADGDKDFDGDLLSNIAELKKYETDPKNAHSVNAGFTDAEYHTLGFNGVLGTGVYLDGPYFVGGNIEFDIIGAAPGAAYDLYIVDAFQPGWQWKRYYSGSSGQTTFVCPMPPYWMAFFCIGLASDADGDSLTDGYEALVSLTVLNNHLTDADNLLDGWEVEYGLKPLVATGEDGDTGNPDSDTLSNLQEQTASTDPKRHNVSQQPRPVVSITVSDPTATESGDTAMFAINRSGSVASPLTVYYVLGGTATIGADYALSPSPSGTYPGYSITIPASFASVQLQVAGMADSLVEGTETVIVGLAPAPTDQYVVATSPHRAMASIRDKVCHTYEVNADFNSGLLVGTIATSDQVHLKGTSDPQFPYINVACSGRGTVVRINVTTGAIVGEYLTAPAGRPSNPSRTTVDQFGNVWVANRNESGLVGEIYKGSVTRIGLLIGGTRCNADGASNPAGQYVKDWDRSQSTVTDRDGDGLIKTSRGLANILPWTNVRSGLGDIDTLGGVATADDEAITEFVRVQDYGTRTIAVDKFNDIWVGGTGSGNGVHEKLNGLLGQVVPNSTFYPGCGGYGGLIDGNGVLWSARGASGLLRFVPPASFPPTSTDWQCFGYSAGNYGLGIDPLTGEIWHTEYDGSSGVYKWNPDGTVAGGPYPTGGTSPKGVVVDSLGNVWVAHSGGTTVGHLLTDGTFIGTVNVGSTPTGLSVDSNGKIWVSNYDSDNTMRIDPAAGPIGLDGITRIGAVELTVDLGDGSGHQAPYNLRASPYNYSDMTGFNNAIVNPGGCSLKGYWSLIEDGGWENTLWASVSWVSSTPAGTAIEVYIRASDDRQTLSTKQFIQAGSGVPLSGVRGRYLEVRTSVSRDACAKDPYLENLTICRLSPTLSAGSIPDQSVTEGQDVQFGVAAIGTEPLSYQWYFNGAAIGLDSPFLTLLAVDCFDSGQYSVHITDASGDAVDVGPANLDVNPRNITIPSSGIASVYPAQITVAGAPSSVSYVEVVVYGFKHDRPDDVDMLLVTPGGKKIMLMSDAGGETAVQNVTMTFAYFGSAPPDDGPLTSGAQYFWSNANYAEQETSLPSAIGGNPNPPAGPYTDSLSDLNSINPNGVWKLYVVDDTGQRSGFISGSWCLILHP